MEKHQLSLLVKQKNERVGFLAIQAVNSVDKKTITAFTKQHIKPPSIVHTGAFCSNVGVADIATHIPKVTPFELVDQWLP